MCGLIIFLLQLYNDVGMLAISNQLMMRMICKGLNLLAVWGDQTTTCLFNCNLTQQTIVYFSIVIFFEIIWNGASMLTNHFIDPVMKIIRRRFLLIRPADCIWRVFAIFDPK
jgi:hypothetical protein